MPASVASSEGSVANTNVAAFKIDEASANITSAELTRLSNISNGVCQFNPASQKGKWIFLLQTILLSFTPIGILLVQNAFMFKEMIDAKNVVLAKDLAVAEATDLAAFIIDLQRERALVSLSLYVGTQLGNKTDLGRVFEKTDATLNRIKWRMYSDEKIFQSKLRFQIKLDDFRAAASQRATNNTHTDVDDTDVLEFYNHATSNLLQALEIDIAGAQSSGNWRLIMTYFNMIKVLESSGIGLVYGLRSYGRGELKVKDMVSYIQHNALVWEYYRQAKELVPGDIGVVIDGLYEGTGFKIVTSSTKEILANILTERDYEKGRIYFEGCLKFMDSLNRVLDMIRQRVKLHGERKLYDSLLAQIWGASVLCFVLLVSPLLVAVARNGMKTTQLFVVSVEKKGVEMKRQEVKRNRLIYKLLPKPIVDRMKAGESVTENFDSATIYINSVVDFCVIVRDTSTPQQVVAFLAELYKVMDTKTEDYNVLKVEVICDRTVLASGVPVKREGDSHALEMCNLALNLAAAGGFVARPDRRPQTIEIMAAVHTGPVVAGVIGTKMPRYCLFGNTLRIATALHRTSSPGRVHISREIKAVVEEAGYHVVTEAEEMDIPGRDREMTYWLEGHDYNKNKKAKAAAPAAN